MAVVVQCYHCNTILELDEGFRGGVCRCSTCGSLLQVPKAGAAGTPKARPAAPGASVTEVKRPADPNADPGLSRGQFDPRQQSGAGPAVSDFGGSSSGLRQGRPSAPTATKIKRVKPISSPSQHIPHAREVRQTGVLIWVGVGLFALIAAVVIVFVIKYWNSVDHEPASRSEATVQAGGSQQIGPLLPVIKGPQFLGIPLVGKHIVLSIDSASSMQDSFDFLRRACYQAMDTLGADQTLVIAVWNDDGVDKIPSSGFVGKAALAQLHDALEGVPVHGSTDPAACMKASLDIGGDQVIFITAKYDLSVELATPILAARKSGQRLDGIKINSEDNPSPFETLARASGGRYIYLTQGALEQAVARP